MDYADFPVDSTGEMLTDSFALGWMTAMIIPMIIIGIISYVFMALALMKMAEKTKTPNGWLAWIPIANLYLMTQIAKVPWWTMLLLFLGFIPVLGAILAIVITIWWWMKIAERLDRPNWWGLMMLIPIVNYVFVYLLAWGKNK